MSQDNIADVYVPRCNNNCYMSYLCGSVRYACDADPLAQTISNCTTIAPKESLVGGRMKFTNLNNPIPARTIESKRVTESG